MEILGIDVGGSGIKGAIVDIETGEFVGSRIRISTPEPAKPKQIARDRSSSRFSRYSGKLS